MVRSLLLLACVALSALAPADAATRYVRVDGGTATQCDGTANAAYPGTGTAQACAWNHPSWALGVNGGAAARISAGDTLIIGNGSYGIGKGHGDNASTNCNTGTNCYLRPLPGGTDALSRTRVLGEDHANGCRVKPELWGDDGVAQVLYLSGSHWAELGCLELTDRSACIRAHQRTEHRCSTVVPFGPWAWHGLYAVDSNNVWIHDLNIHGFSDYGIRAGRLSNFLMERTRVSSNGWGGWNGDVASGNVDGSPNSGTMTFKNVEFSWNGCTEAYPKANAVLCWGQQSGGYGDGFGTMTTAGDWLFEDSTFHHNTSDGLDMLYANDTATVTVRRVWAYSNGGNALKLRGRAMLVENSFASADCSYFYPAYLPQMAAGDSCRADGNTLSLTIPATSSGDVITLRYNTITGEGDFQILLRGDGHAGSNVVVQNNVLVGHPQWNTADTSGGIYTITGAPTVTLHKNLWYGIKAGYCPAPSVCTSPLLKDQSIRSFNPRVQAGSPAIAAADMTKPKPATDILGRPRPATATLGAFEP